MKPILYIGAVTQRSVGVLAMSAEVVVTGPNPPRRLTRVAPRFCPKGADGKYSGANELWKKSRTLPFEVFGFFDDTSGAFLQISKGAVNQDAPTVSRDWPSSELKSEVHTVAAHSHPYSKDRPYDPPSVADAMIFILFYIVTGGKRKYHCVFTHSCIYTMMLDKNSPILLQLGGECRESSPETCERALFRRIEKISVERIKRPLLQRFRNEGYTDIDSFSDPRLFSALNNRDSLREYLSIFKTALGVTIFTEFT